MTITWKKAVGITGAMSLSLALAACGDSSSEPAAESANSEAPAEVTDVNLSVWAPQEDQVDDSSWLPKMQAAFEDAHPEYNITWTNEVVSEGDAMAKVQTDPAAAADVYLFANDQLGTLVDLGAIGQLGENELAQVTEQNDQSMIDSVTGVDGNVYGVPFTGNTWFMYYNSSVLSEEDVKSFDTILEKANVTFPLNNSWYIQAFYTGGAGLTFFGGGTSTDAEKAISFSSVEDATAVTEYLANLVANPKFSNDADGSGLAQIQAGTADVYFSGTWDAAAVKEALGDNYAAAQLPSFNVNGKDAQMHSFFGSKAIAYNPNAENTKAAAQFAAFLGSDEAQQAHYEMRGIVPTSTALTGIVGEDDAAAAAQIATLTNTSIIQPSISAMGSWWDPAAAFGTGLVNKETTTANAADQTQLWSDQLAEMK